MAGGQSITSGQGSVTQSETVALLGGASTFATGTIVADAGSGIVIDGEQTDAGQGTATSGEVIALRSRKVGAGSASRALVGSQSTSAIQSLTFVSSKTPTGLASSSAVGSVAKSRTKALTGTAVSVPAGTLTFSNQNDPTWVGVVPTITFASGQTDNYDLTRHTLSFNPTLHAFQVASGTLPSGVTLNPTFGYIYDGVGAVNSASVSVNIVDSPLALTGLDWDGTAPARRMLYWLNPPTAIPMTYYFKVYYRLQVSGIGDGSQYYTTFFHGNNGEFAWSASTYARSYYGAHPYPSHNDGSPPNSIGPGKWEISIDAGDFRAFDSNTSANPDSSAVPAITANQWYSQAFVASGTTTSYNTKFYTNLPSVATSTTISHGPSGPYVVPPIPAIVMGQAPDFNGQSWGGYSRWEEANEIIRGVAIFTGAHTQSQILALSAAESDSQMLSAMAVQGISASTLYYLNMNPTPTDVTDKKGSGTLHHGSWAGSARPGLYTTLTPDSDFASRISASNAFRFFGFNSAADLGGTYNDNYGTIAGTGGSNGPITLDTSIKASGSSSLRFRLNAGGDSPHGGTGGSNASWFTNFHPNLQRYGESTTFFLQFKCRLSIEAFQDWAHKFFLCGTGDDGATSPNPTSCSDLEICMQHLSNPGGAVTQARSAPVLYNACPGDCGGTFNLHESLSGGTDFDYQPHAGAAVCKYSNEPNPTCFQFVPEQWMVFQLGVDVGTKINSGGHSWFSGSRVRLWYQTNPGATENLIVDVTYGVTPLPSSPPGLCAGHGGTGDKRYGKLWLLPYTQNSIGSSARQAHVWYDELILAEQKIPAALA